MRKLAKREKIIVAVVGLAAVVFLINQFLIEPQIRRLREVRAELAAADQQYASLLPKLGDLKGLSLDVVKKERQLAELEQVMSHKAEIAEIIHEISREAQIHGLQLQNLRPQTRAVGAQGGRPGEFRRSFIDLGIRGQYQQLGNFVNALEQQPFYVKITGLRVQRGDQQARLLNIQLKLVVVVRS